VAIPSTRPAVAIGGPVTARRPGSGGSTGAGPITSGAVPAMVTGSGGSVAHSRVGRRAGAAGDPPERTAGSGAEPVPFRRNGQRIASP
jgi:hypothetical protein